LPRERGLRLLALLALSISSLRVVVVDQIMVAGEPVVFVLEQVYPLLLERITQ
jgi:hypothetical protein